MIYLPPGLLSHILSFNDTRVLREMEGRTLRTKWSRVIAEDENITEIIMADWVDFDEDEREYWHKALKRRETKMRKIKFGHCMEEIRFESRNSGKGYPLTQLLWSI